MHIKGEGYSVGPGYENQGEMVFDIGGPSSEGKYMLLIREDRPFETDNDKRRSENAIEGVALNQLQDLAAYIARATEAERKLENFKRMRDDD